MAVIDAIPGLMAEITVDGTALHEYDNDEDDSTPNAVTKYIEAESGVNFIIRYNFDSRFRSRSGVSVRVIVDGKEADDVVVRKSHLPFPKPKEISGARERVGAQHYKRDFLFSELRIDDGNYGPVGENLMKQLKDIGEISILFNHVAIEKRQGRKAQVDKISNVPRLGAIPEQALKGSAISHQASFANREPTKALKSICTRFLDGGKDQWFASINFKYRSRAALKSLLVIPRSPSPVPLDDRELDDLTPGDMRELVKLLRERDKASRVVKQEGVKRERSQNDNGIEDDEDVHFVSSKRQRTKLYMTVDEHGVETIDLT